MRKKSRVEEIRATTAAVSEMAKRLRYFAERQNEVAETIRQLVEIESPSDNKQAVDRLGSMLAGRFESLGGHAKFHRAQDYGDHLQVDGCVGRGWGWAWCRGGDCCVRCGGRRRLSGNRQSEGQTAASHE